VTKRDAETNEFQFRIRNLLRTQTPTQIIDNLNLRFVVSFATAAFEIDILNCEASFLVEGPDFELKISIVD
jgi:hypothetical protein